jgi:hypothetical protein
MLDGRTVLDAAGRFLRDNPQEVSRFVRSTLGLRVGVPLSAFRWVIAQLLADADGLDPEIIAVPPGLRIGVTIDKMETKIRFSTVLHITRVDVSGEQARIEVRLDDVQLRILSDKKTIPAALVKSGALNISQIGSLVNELPGLPPFIVEAHGTTMVFDLMRSPRIASNPAVRHIVAALSSLITVDGVRTESSDHLDVVFRALPRGGVAAIDALTSHVVAPGLRRVRGFIDAPPNRSLVYR